MKNDGISYGPLVEQLVLLVLATAGLGAILASGFYIFSILFVPLVGLCIYRIIRRYGESIRRVTFMFNAIDNDDLTFRFRDDEAEADNRMLNTALNRIKEIIVRAKLRAEERDERQFVHCAYQLCGYTRYGKSRRRSVYLFHAFSMRLCRRAYFSDSRFRSSAAVRERICFNGARRISAITRRNKRGSHELRQWQAERKSYERGRRKARNSADENKYNKRNEQKAADERRWAPYGARRL